MAKREKQDINRYFVAILYKEDPNFEIYFKSIQKNFLEVTYIEHDKDYNEDETPKKPHFHVLFKVGENARHRTSVAKIIGIEPNYLQGCNKVAMLQYLIHLNNPEKTQYNIEEVHGELKKELEKYLYKSKPEEERYKPIIEAIQTGKIKSVTMLFCYAIGHNCLEEVKRCQYLLCKAIEEKWEIEDNKNVTRKLQ